MEILLSQQANKLMVGDLCDSSQIKLVTTGKKRWCDSIRIKLVPASDTSIDFQIDFSISIDETVTHWFTLTVLSALRCSGTNKDGNVVPPSRSDEVLKLKNFKKDASLQLLSYQIKKGILKVKITTTYSQDEVMK
ncbi:hypothetical protein Tco_0595819 [Tanacetum coccineum]